MSISFTDFYKKGAGTFHYPFGGIDTTGNKYAKNDWYLKKFMYPDTPISDYADCMYPIMSLVNQNRITTESKIPGYMFTRDVAVHFDAAKFGAWLRDKRAKPMGVKHIQGKVNDIQTDEDGIKKLVLDSGEEITADLYIDCTGFRSILLGGALGEKFNSYEDILPNNSAWAAQVPYNDKKKEIVPWTDCHAIGNGWVWRIPLWHRMGMGYVYSDKYIDDDGALQEFKDHLAEHNQLHEDQKFHKIKFRAGIHERIWVKNVAAIGLSAGFIEPLESNGLYSVHMFLVRLLRAIDRDGDQHMVSEFDKNSYNWACRTMFDSFAQFVAMHYAMSHRDDTEYWRDVGKRNYCDVDKSVMRGSSRNEAFIIAYESKFNTTRFSNDGLNAIATGLNYFSTDLHYIHSMNESGMNLAEEFQEVTENLNRKKELWDLISSKCPTVYDFLKERIYHGEE